MNDNEESEIILPVSDVEILAAFQSGRKDTGIDLEATVELSGGCVSQIVEDFRRDLVDELSYLSKGTRPPEGLPPWMDTRISNSYLSRLADAMEQAAGELRKLRDKE
jgi:non-ribosomal peptide synthetase component F